jgi:hypothetical protein
MKKASVLLIVLGSLLTGCAAYVVDVPVASNSHYSGDRFVAPGYTYRYRDLDNGGY